MKKILQKTTIIIIIVCYIFLIGLSFVRPLVMKNIMDEGLIHSDLQVIFTFSVLLIVLSFVEELITLLQTRLCIDLKNEIVLKLYLKVFQKLLRVRNTYFSQNHSAEIINKITTDINSIGTLIDSSSDEQRRELLAKANMMTPSILAGTTSRADVSKEWIKIASAVVGASALMGPLGIGAGIAAVNVWLAKSLADRRKKPKKDKG